MACGIPCVVTDVGDAKEIVGNYGFVFESGNYKALASCWMKLVDMGKEGRVDLGKKAKNRIKEKFSLNKIYQDYDNLHYNSNQVKLYE